MVFLPAAVGPFWLGYVLGKPRAASKEINRVQLATGLALAALPLMLRFTKRGARTYIELLHSTKTKALTQSLYSADGVGGGMHGLKLKRFRNVCLLAAASSLGLGIAASSLVDAKESPQELQKSKPVSIFGRGVSWAVALPTAFAVLYTPLTMVPALGVIYGTKYVSGK